MFHGALGYSWDLRLHIINNFHSPTFNFVKDFWHKRLNGFKPFHHKPQCWELTAAITDQLLCQHLRKNLLKPQGLEPSECSSWRWGWKKRINKQMMDFKIRNSCTYLHMPNTQWPCGPSKEFMQLLTNPEVQFLPHVHSITHSLIRLGQIFAGHSHGSGGDLRKTCSQHLNSGLYCGTESPRLKLSHTALSSLTALNKK